MTIASATLVDGAEHATVRLGDGTVVHTRVPRDSLPNGEALEIGLRPESVRVSPPGEGTAPAEVILVERLGERSLVYAKLSDATPITAEDKGTTALKPGDSVALAIDGAAAHLFGPDGTGYHRLTA
jgi:multiple sugar transport system ATP-binding protein